MTTRPNISVVIPVHDEGRHLFLTLETLRFATGVPYEVIVVDDGSTDHCCDFLALPPEDFPNVTLLRGKRHGSVQARNLGSKQASADVVIFMDAHCFPRPGWVEPLVAALAQGGVGIMTPCMSVAGNPSLRRFGMMLQGPRLTGAWLSRQQSDPYDVPVASAGCTAVRASMLSELGGFDSMRTFGGEDIDLSRRCWCFGHSVLVVPESTVAHRVKTEPDYA
jgi:GT2 family glycosyltransferase